MSEARDAVARAAEESEDTQWVVVCLDSEYGPPIVFAAWDTEKEATDWLYEEHMDSDADVKDDWFPESETRDFCKNGSSDLDHYVVAVVDQT
jgi:hypothetical protein